MARMERCLKKWQTLLLAEAEEEADLAAQALTLAELAELELEVLAVAVAVLVETVEFLAPEELAETDISS